MGRRPAGVAGPGRGRGLRALDFHGLTAHHPGGRRRTDPRLVRGFQPMELGRQPPPFKRYDDLPAVELAGTLEPGSLGRLLFLSAGVVRRLDRGTRSLWFRAAGSAGNLAPVEVYVVWGGGEDLAAGLYHYQPLDHALVRLGDAPAGTRPALVLTGVPWRTGWKYGERGFRHLWWDAGTMLAQVLEVTAADGRDARVEVAFVDGEVAALVGARPPHELPLAVVGLDGPPALPAVAPSGVPTGHLAREPVEFPAVTAAYEAGCLHAERDVARWRRQAAGYGHPAPASGERLMTPLEELIRRRGSTRELAPGRLAPPGLLAGGAPWAARAVPGDWAGAGRSLLTHHAFVYASPDADPGVYAVGPDGLERIDVGPIDLGAIDLMAAGPAAGDPAGELRALGRNLCLNQELGGSGAFTVFHGAHLDGLVGSGDDRAWRAAHLEAGIVSGRLQLAAFDRGAGATGLTFFDDEVRRRTGTWPLLVTAVGVPAYRSRPGGRPRRPTRLRAP